MSLITYLFKPKHGIEIARKVVNAFADEFLNWPDTGISWDIVRSNDEGWYKLTVWPDDGYECFTETSYSTDPISGSSLADCMLVLLVEAGITQEVEGAHYLEEVELSEIISVLSCEDECIYSPYEDRVWVYNPKTGDAKTVDMTDFILSQAA